MQNDRSFQSFTPVASRWLEWQCNMVSEVKIGAVFLKKANADDALDMLAGWPENTYAKMEKTLYELARNVIEGQYNIPSKVTCQLAKESTVCDTVTLPLHENNEIVGAVIFLQSVRSEDQKKAVTQLFKWGCTWLESTLAAEQDEQNQSHPILTELTKLALKDVPVAVSGNEICNMLAERFSCTRVVFGMTKGLHMQTVALSHQLRFDKKTSPIIQQIEVAMEESMDQNQIIVYPKPDEMLSWVTFKHQALSDSQEDASILTIPFGISETKKGSLMLLRPRNKPFTQQEVNLLAHASGLVGDTLALKLRSEKPLFRLLTQSIKKKVTQLFGRQRLGLKLSLLTAAVVLSIFGMVQIDNYTYAKSSMEGSIRHIIVASQNGFIESSDVRAGDHVRAGQVLVRLNSRDLELEEEKLHSERDKIHKEYQEALALRERAKVSILSAQIAQVEARLGLVKQHLARSQLKAPFSGIVVWGDLSQSLGAPVEKGEALFEVSPLGDYRVVMQVDDHDISQLHIGQEGSLRLMGLPYDRLAVKVSRITPVASAQDGGNYFRVEGAISDMNNSAIRPGMQGIAKIKVGEGSALWVWTHSLFDRLRLWFWSIGL